MVVPDTWSVVSKDKLILHAYDIDEDLQSVEYNGPNRYGVPKRCLIASTPFCPMRNCLECEKNGQNAVFGSTTIVQISLNHASSKECPLYSPGKFKNEDIQWKRTMRHIITHSRMASIEVGYMNEMKWTFAYCWICWRSGPELDFLLRTPHWAHDIRLSTGSWRTHSHRNSHSCFDYRWHRNISDVCSMVCDFYAKTDSTNMNRYNLFNRLDHWNWTDTLLTRVCVYS